MRSKAPPTETLYDHHLRYMLGVKEGVHASLFTQVQAAEHAGRVLSDERHDRAVGGVHRLRLVNDVTRNASNTDVQAHCIEYWEIGADKILPFRGGRPCG